MKKAYAFTILELLVVVVIVGILASMALPNFGKAVEKAKVRDAQGTLNMIYQAERMYKLDQGTYGTLDNLITNQYLADPRSAGSPFNYAAVNTGATAFTGTVTRVGGGSTYDGKTIIVDQSFDSKSYQGTHPLRDNPI